MIPATASLLLQEHAQHASELVSLILLLLPLPFEPVSDLLGFLLLAILPTFKDSKASDTALMYSTGPFIRFPHSDNDGEISKTFEFDRLRINIDAEFSRQLENGLGVD